ncbi:MAG: SMP-30/gluconolactonase/LRE family protein [Candidatus Binatia bacterium]|nr:SMP-30/gluconolactonase/LRE family protein [Candidatus Binatia bacterium]
MQFEEIVSGLRFPEGPIAMPNGDIVVVEIERGTLSRVTPEGKIEVIAETGGGPNGAAIGPDGRCYVCNNGGFAWHRVGDMLIPGDQPDDYSGGRIEAVSLDDGAIEVLYTECDGNPLRGPNDIVFDREGGFYFTDLGKSHGRQMDRGAVFYAKTDGSLVREIVFPANTPNGISLSPDETRLYVAETVPGRVFAYHVKEPGVLERQLPMEECLAGVSGYQFFDSMTVDADGHVCVATIINGGITRISPDGATVEHFPTDDPLTTNICFGGEGLRTAYVTLSSSGRLVKSTWPTGGLPLNFLNV